MRRAVGYLGGVQASEADLASKSSSVTCCVALGELHNCSERRLSLFLCVGDGGGVKFR